MKVLSSKPQNTLVSKMSIQFKCMSTYPKYALEDSQILDIIFSEHNYVYWNKMWLICGVKTFGSTCGKECKDGSCPRSMIT